MEHDPEIQALIRQWAPPDASPGLDARMMARFHARRQGFWNRRLELRASIRAPALAALLLLTLACGVWFGLEIEGRNSFRKRMGGFEPVAAPQLRTSARIAPPEARQ